MRTSPDSIRPTAELTARNIAAKPASRGVPKYRLVVHILPESHHSHLSISPRMSIPARGLRAAIGVVGKGDPMSAEKLRQCPDLLEKSLGDETLLYDAGGGMIHILNVTAQSIWALCDGEHTVAEIAQTLAARFDLSDQLIDLECDVKETLALFSQKGLLDS